MNSKILSTLTAAAAAATAIFGAVSTPVQAAELFGNSGFKFDQNTDVDFNFISSQGSYTSALKLFTEDGTFVTNLFAETKRSDTNQGGTWQEDWLGTCGITVVGCSKTVTLQAGVTYKLGLESVAVSNQAVPTVYSNSTQAKFFNDGGLPNVNSPLNSSRRNTLKNGIGVANANPLAGTVAIAFEDALLNAPGADIDYDDFVLTASARRSPITSVPEPATLAGIGMIAGSLLVSRRRRAVN